MSAIINCAESGQLENVAAGYTPELTGLIATQDVLTTQRSFSYDDFSRRISEADGLSRSWQYRYDANNNLTTATDPLNQITTYTWNYGNQLATLRDNNAQNYTYTRNNRERPANHTYTLNQVCVNAAATFHE